MFAMLFLAPKRARIYSFTRRHRTHTLKKNKSVSGGATFWGWSEVWFELEGRRIHFIQILNPGRAEGRAYSRMHWILNEPALPHSQVPCKDLQWYHLQKPFREDTVQHKRHFITGCALRRQEAFTLSSERTSADRQIRPEPSASRHPVSS